MTQEDILKNYQCENQISIYDFPEYLPESLKGQSDARIRENDENSLEETKSNDKARNR